MCAVLGYDQIWSVTLDESYEKEMEVNSSSSINLDIINLIKPCKWLNKNSIHVKS